MKHFYSILLVFFSFTSFSQHATDQINLWIGTLPKVAVSDNSNLIATFQKYTCSIFIASPEGEDKTIKIPEWEGQELFAVFSPDERYLVASVVGGNTIKVYDVPSYDLRIQFELKDHVNYNMDVSNNGNLAITDGAKVYLYKLQDAKKKSKPYSIIDKSSIKFLYGLAFQPNTENLAVGGLGVVELINIENQQNLYKYFFADQKKRGYITPLTQLVFDKSGQHLAMGDDYSLASVPEDERHSTGFTIVDLNTKEVTLSESMGGRSISGFAISEDLSSVMVANRSGFIYKYNMSGDVVANIKTIENTSIAPGAKQNQMIVHDPFGVRMARLWNFTEWDEIPDGKYLLGGSLEPFEEESDSPNVNLREVKKPIQELSNIEEEDAKMKAAEEQAAAIIAAALNESKAVNEKRKSKEEEKRPSDAGYEQVYEQDGLIIKYRITAYAPSSGATNMAKVGVVILNDSGSEKSGKFLLAYGDGTNAEGQEIDFCISDTAGKKLQFMSEEVTSKVDKVEVIKFIMKTGCN